MLSVLASVGKTFYWEFEKDFIIWLQSLGGKGSFIYYIMQFFTLFGEEFFLVAVMGLIYWGLDKRRGERIGFFLLTTTLLNPLIKNIVRRNRPFNSTPGLIKNFKDVSGFSFPSGHSSGSASVLVGTSVVYNNSVHRKWLIPVAIVVPILVALSRNYLGAHWITDVFCGLALGTGVVFLFQYILEKVKNVKYGKYIVYCSVLLIGVAGMFYCTTSDYFTGFGILTGFIAGIFFEEKVVHFENTDVWWRIILRVLVGGGLYLGLNTLIKLPFNNLIFETVNGESVIKADMVVFERAFRTIRYAVVSFVAIGVYPLLFKPCTKLWAKLGWKDKRDREIIIDDEETEEIPSDESKAEEK